VQTFGYGTSDEETAAKKAEQVEILTVGSPDELQGVEMLWNIILENKHEKVVEKSIEFLISLYMVVMFMKFKRFFKNIQNEAEENVIQIRKMIVEKCMKSLDYYRLEKNKEIKKVNK